MILGYSYEQVRSDRAQRYGHFDDNTFWWEHYLDDEGRFCAYLPITQLDVIETGGGELLGLLVMSNHRIRKAHIAVVDELGFVDPSDGFPDHMRADRYAQIKRSQGFEFDDEFLAVAPNIGQATQD